MDQIPIVALCGFLGSGKTTLLRRWLRYEEFLDAAVIAHDLSEFGLDAELLSVRELMPAAGRLTGRVAALHGRHAREQLYTSVGGALDEIFALDPVVPLVLCESTGAARPWPLIKALTQDKRYFLRHFIVTADALNLHRDFADGRILVDKSTGSQDVAIRHAAEVLVEQIAFANVIILTKIDTIPESAVEAQTRILQKLQPHATIGLSAYAGLLLPQLDKTPAPKLSALKGRAKQLGLNQHSSTADNIEAVVFRDPRPFHPERLYEVCRSKLTTGLYRTKGFLWLVSRPGYSLLWEQSGSQIALEIKGFWRAEIALNRDGRMFPEEVERLDELKAQLKKQHPIFGDRHNEITFIGLKAAIESFSSALEDALCTDEEITAWQNGETFPDPWPQNIRRID
ncbi:MAG: GTP-binding protein [Cyanobacteria bacterium P01_C01_bin.118]